MDVQWTCNAFGYLNCGNYDRAAEKCGVNSASIYIGEAESPKEYSKSYKCPDYKPKYEAQAHKVLKAA